MKKLRMIATSVVVLAIVGGAFAFKTKAGAFCVVSTSAINNNCTAILKEFRITTNAAATQYRYFPAWDGTQTVCTLDASGKCDHTFRLTTD